jgi:hypothetical protein
LKVKLTRLKGEENYAGDLKKRQGNILDSILIPSTKVGRYLPLSRQEARKGHFRKVEKSLLFAKYLAQKKRMDSQISKSLT